MQSAKHSTKRPQPSVAFPSKGLEFVFFVTVVVWTLLSLSFIIGLLRKEWLPGAMHGVFWGDKKRKLWRGNLNKCLTIKMLKKSENVRLWSNMKNTIWEWLQHMEDSLSVKTIAISNLSLFSNVGNNGTIGNFFAFSRHLFNRRKCKCQIAFLISTKNLQKEFVIKSRPSHWATHYNTTAKRYTHYASSWSFYLFWSTELLRSNNRYELKLSISDHETLRFF